MSLESQINKDYIQAMKNKEKEKAGAINFLRAAIKQVKVDERLEEVSDDRIIAIIKKQVKQREDSIKQFEDGGRPELAESERKEADILLAYLPEQMSQDKVEELVVQVISESGATSIKDMGSVMKEVLAKTAGQADGKVVSDVVKAKLGSL